MGLNKDDKENFSNNIQVQGHNKLVKLRESLEQCNQPEKVISSIRLESKEDSEKGEPSLKRTYSELVKQDYSAQILEALILRDTDVSEALKPHLITQQLRAKMVDWMI